MTKRYEKFEEWMVGKKVELEYGNRGVVARSDEDWTDTVWVLWETSWAGETELWCMVSELTFLETQDCEPESIPWEEGQVVWDVIYGKGVVSGVKEDHIFPVKVKFDDGGRESYTFQGSFYESGPRSLYFSEPKIIAETMPPKKPFVPKLKEGDVVVAWFEDGSKYFITIREETATAVIDDTGDSFLKNEVRFLKIGEEIKWD